MSLNLLSTHRTGLAMSMAMPRGRQGRACLCQPGTTGLWATGSPGNGRGCPSRSERLGHWRRLRGGLGVAFSRDMGRLSVVSRGVGVGIGING